MIGGNPDVQLCPIEAREAALQVLYQRVPQSLRSQLIGEVLLEESGGRTDLSGLWVAWDRHWGSVNPRRRIVGTLLTQPLAGRAAAIWAPEVVPSWRRDATAAALVRSALNDLHSRGFRIVQAVLDESSSRHGAADLTRGGVPRVTELLYLERDTQRPLAESLRLGSPSKTQCVSPLLVWTCFNAVDEAEFRALLQATYQSSLDMPELEQVRSLDDILEGHRATGRFVPEHWQVGKVPGMPEVGVILLLSEILDRDVWEVVYLGLTVPARGRGLGLAALDHALELARPYVSHLELAVDTRNVPALRLYDTAGFVSFDRRAVHLAVFPEAGP